MNARVRLGLHRASLRMSSKQQMVLLLWAKPHLPSPRDCECPRRTLSSIDRSESLGPGDPGQFPGVRTESI